MANQQVNDTPFSGEKTKAERRRLKIHADFKALTPNVYYEPPENVRLIYPCIIYERTSGRSSYSNNLPYSFDFRYKVTIISKDPDDRMVEKLASTQECCSFDRAYQSDNLYHSVFTLY